MKENHIDDAGEYFLVLDECGRIDLLDKETLQFAGIAGYLPGPQTFFPSKENVTPKDVLSYRVKPLAFATDNKYRGMCAASVSREGTSMALAIYDENGRLVGTDYTKAKKYDRDAGYSKSRTIPSSRAFYFAGPWAPFNTIVKYALENLQPPIFSIISYFTASSFEAGSGYRALFILPNSFIGMLGREVGDNAVARFVVALFMISPSIILGVFIAWRVGKDAATVGLTENTKLCWMAWAVAFGPVAYITYRLTRPKVTLVTCPNCGRLRRPDMDKCHRCGSGWVVAEMIAPNWRVINRDFTGEEQGKLRVEEGDKD